MHIFLNGLAASSGAGLTYLRNVVPQFAGTDCVHTTLALQPNLRSEFEGLPSVDVITPPGIRSVARRFWYEQKQLPSIIRKTGADVLLSAGNFALHNSPIPQILLSGNSLYTSKIFYRDLLSRHEYGMLADTFIKGYLARESVHWAERTIAPSQAFAAELQNWTGQAINVVPHGFDRDIFFRSNTQPSSELNEKLRKSEGSLRLLFVSHYNYYRNFETLLRALPLVQQYMYPWKVKLLLTCKLEPGCNPGEYHSGAAARLVRDLVIKDSVDELGAVPYECLHHIYRACDIYVTPAYTETFAHPLVEAMASKLPIVASDLQVHREVCGEAAIYFSTFDSRSLAEKISLLAINPGLRSQLAEAGNRRAEDFNWSSHVAELLQIANELRYSQARSGCELLSNPVINQPLRANSRTGI